jgi:hypothetical protein
MVASHQLTMRTPDLNCGLFSFDRSLVFSIISATAIYLLFLVQFDLASIKNAEMLNATNITDMTIEKN